MNKDQVRLRAVDCVWTHRQTETWNKAGVGFRERFQFLYSEAELNEVLPAVKQLRDCAAETHVIFNNCYEHFSVRATQRNWSICRGRNSVGT